MSGREVRRYVEELLSGRRPHGFRPDEDEAQEMSTAIELRAARLGSDAPSEEFLIGLQRRLGAEIAGVQEDSHDTGGTRRRDVLIGTSAAAAAATVAVVVDSALTGHDDANSPAAQSTLEPNAGLWRPVAASADLPEGGTVAFDIGALSGFIRRANGIAVGVSGVCTHQGCKLWLDAPADRLRCPCHSTSFATDGKVLTHQLPISPAPLPTLRVRENNGAIEVFGPMV
ncbi:Rieske 2Fe-2S domain-containing protein [Nocardia sp. SYP-A9097]|uniref:QcrA and Rieske domain-containing protein n=1 Tax=Nocardia sp. SYP-A9097 TaxID=2663237 RepID=UPI00132868F2|nr:Rieske (2Fe-2S) protein [Nocardia sp. SYP-A9097]MRH89727.1 Rieske 2Fe-2S domain-containing protein [Nocardia sp. SYP-A9097]